MTTSLSDAVAQTERALLGSLLLDDSLWSQTEAVSVDDFSLESHRRIYRCMASMAEDRCPIDEVTLPHELEKRNELESIGGLAYISTLLDGVVPKNIATYINSVRQASTERRVSRQVELITKTCQMRTPGMLDHLREQAQQLLDSLDDRTADDESLFHSYEETMNAPQARFAIDGFLQEDGITLIGGLSGHGKTWIMLSMVRALLEGGKLFQHFAVNKPAERVIYLIPEAGLPPFATRLKTFHLEQYVRERRLSYRTLSAKGQLPLTDKRLLKAVNGAHVHLDTAIRFMQGDENSATEQKVFADNLFNLQRAGARTITGAHHSPKSFGTQNFMTLENILRGSGDIGAMLTTCWGVCQIDAAKNRIYVQNVKARDFLPCEPFVIQGRPSIDQTGYFELISPPGFAGTLRDNKPEAGRPQIADKDAKIAEARKMREEGKGCREIARDLGVSVGTVSGWLSKRSKSVQ